MTNTKARKLTARQLSAKLAEIDYQITGIRAVLAGFLSTFGAGRISDEVYTAWNAARDALDALEAHRVVVAENAAPLSYSEQITRDLILANCD